MDYAYVAYTKERKLIKGRISASNQETAAGILRQSGYQVVNLKAKPKYFDLDKLNAQLSRVSAGEILLFSRQLALLIESGMDIVTSLELISEQVPKAAFKAVIADIIADIREGKSLSAAMSRHPKIFPAMYHRAVAAGEQGGSLDVILRQMADFLEKSIDTKKKLKAALTYPVIIVVLAIAVLAVLTVFVFPTFINLFDSLGAKLPPLTQLLFDIVQFFINYGLYLLIVIIAAVIALYAYTRTKTGKYNFDKNIIRAPVIGRMILLNELSYICRLIALLIKAGLSLPEILRLAIYGTTNTYIGEALTQVQAELIRGEGLSRPMSKRKVFLPLMVQMISIGEESGNLNNSLNTIAQSYETEADDRTRAAIGLIQPVITIILGLLVVFIAVSLVSAMFGIYGQIE